MPSPWPYMMQIWTTVEPDTVNVRIKVEWRGTGFQAKETEESWGFQASGDCSTRSEKQRYWVNTIEVPAGETIYATYRDEETTNPASCRPHWFDNPCRIPTTPVPDRAC